MRARFCVVAVGVASIAHGQGRPLDWPFFGGDAQRSGWEKSDLRITKENVKDFQLVLKHKLETKSGDRSLTPPVVIGNLISYKGFKELAFVAGSSGRIWALDADIDRIFWQKQLASKSAGCSGGAMATPTLTPPTNFSAPRPRPTPPGTQSPGAPPSPAATRLAAAKPSVLGSTGFGSPRPAFALSKDGRLHVLNTSTGDDLVEPIPFVPANSRASSLTIAGGVLYTTTTDCAGKTGSVSAIDLNTEAREVTHAALRSGTPVGLAGIAVGTTGTIYISGSNGSVSAFSPKALTEIGVLPATGKSSGTATPVVFSYKDRDMIVAATGDGKLALLDAKQISTPVYQTPAIGTLWGGISSWQDADGTRWVAAPVWGAVNAELKFGIANGPAASGSLVAFKVEEPNGLPVLAPAWISRNLESPEPPVITSGVVFTVAAGKRGSHAILYALDAATGNEMYSTKDQVPELANLNGLSIANGRVYFTTVDGTLYGFGIHLEI
jgi:outer membrane protein assembly factor BamB